MHTGDGVSVLPRLVNDRSIHAFISGGGAINGVPIAALMSNRPTTSAQGTQTAPDDPRQDDPDEAVAYEAQLLALDYIQYRLSKLDNDAYEWSDCPELPPPSRLRLVMRQLGVEFEERYGAMLAMMIERLHVNADTVYPSFVTASRELFADGVNWGRIVALFAFGGALACHCAQNGMHDRIINMAQWVHGYVASELRPWIVAHGGWDGFVAFYESSPTDTRGRPQWLDFAFVSILKRAFT